MSTGLLILLALWGACVFGGYKIMESKGRSTVTGGVLGFLLGVFGLIICACLSKTIEKRAEEQAMIRSILGD